MRAAAALLSLALLLGGCSHASLPGQAVSIAALAAQAEAKKKAAKRPSAAAVEAALAAHLRQAFLTGFYTLDADHDGALAGTDFAGNAQRFAKVLGRYDADKNGQIAFAEYYPAKRAAELLSSVQARATVSAMGVGGHVTADKLQFMFGVYLQDRIPNEQQRTQEIDGAFAAADLDRTHQLSDDEVALALAILEARADVIQIQRQLGSVDPTAAPLPAVDPDAEPENRRPA